MKRGVRVPIDEWFSTREARDRAYEEKKNTPGIYGVKKRKEQ